MAKTLVDAIKQVQTLARGLTGVDRAPDFPPGIMPQGIFAVAGPLRASWDGGPAGYKKGLVSIVCLILKAYKDLARDMETMAPYGELMANALWKDPQLNQTCDTIVGPVTATFSETITYNQGQCIGWRIEIPIKQQSAAS